MKRLLKWVSLLAATGAFAIAMIVAVVKYNSWTEDYNKFRERLDQLANVKLGETQQELLYAYGKPNMVRMAEYDASRPNDEKSAIHFTDIDLPKGTKVEDYAIWQWSWDGLDLTAKFDPKSKKVIQLNCIAGMDDKSDGLVCLTVGGVGLGRDKSTSGYAFYRRTEDYIVGILGKPDVTAQVVGTEADQVTAKRPSTRSRIALSADWPERRAVPVTERYPAWI